MKWLTFIILVVGLIFSSVLIQWIPGQGDFTINKMYTLSEGSEKLLEKIEEPITLQFYFSSSVEQIMDESTTIFFKNYAARIEGLLNQFVRASNGNIVLEKIDPRPDTQEEEEATRGGLQSQELPTGESLFLGLLAIQADQEETITIFNPQREALIEYDIAQVIYKVQQIDKPKVGLITSLPVMGSEIPPMAMMQNPNLRPDPKWYFVEELEAHYDIVEIQGNETTLPKDLNALVIVHPKGLSQQLQYEIDQYIMEDNPAFISVDSSSYIERSQQQSRGGMFMGPQGTASDLETLFKAYGIVFDQSKFVGDRQKASLVGGRNGQPTRHPAWITIGNLDKNSPITANLDTLVFAETGSFSIHSSVINKMKIEAYAESSEQSSDLDTTMLPYGTPENLMQSVGIGDPKTLAGFVRGTFKTAFPEGKPDPMEAPKEGEEPKEQTFSKSDQHKENSSENAKLFVLADTDFLADPFTVQRINILGMNAIEPLNSNVAFFRNVLDSLAGSDDLIGIRGKGSSTRPFTLVNEIKMVAEQNFQNELEQVNTELSNIRQSISELQRSNTDTNSIVLTPEVRKQLLKFKEQEAQIMSRRREIRKELREDIERLDSMLAGVNLLVVPLIIGIFGVNFFRKRYAFR